MNHSYQLTKFISLASDTANYVSFGDDYDEVDRLRKLQNDRDSTYNKDLDHLFIFINIIIFIVYCYIIWKFINSSSKSSFLSTSIIITFFIFMFVIWNDNIFKIKIFEEDAFVKRNNLVYIINKMNKSHVNMSISLINNLIEELQNDRIFPKQNNKYIATGSLFVVFGFLYDKNNYSSIHSIVDYLPFSFVKSPTFLFIMLLFTITLSINMYIAIHAQQRRLIIANYYLLSIKNYILDDYKISDFD